MAPRGAAADGVSLQAAAVRVPRRLSLVARVAYGRQAVRVRLSPLGERHVLHGARLEVLLVHSRDARIAQRAVLGPVDEAPLDEAVFAVPAHAFSAYTLAAEVVDRHGHRFAARVLHDSAGDGLPAWYGSRTGVGTGVPAPWTPLRVRHRPGLRVDCWGRGYRFDGSSLLAGAEALGRSLLAGPVRVLARVEGTEVAWRRGRLLGLSAQDDQVVFACTRTSAAGLRFRARTEIDFDGLVRIDWQVRADRDLRLDALVVEMPVRAEVARSWYHMPGQPGEPRNAGRLGRRRRRLGFEYYVWFGDEEAGLAWCTDGDEDWRDAAGRRPLEVVPGPDAVTLRLHLVAAPLRLAAPDTAALEAREVGQVRREPECGAAVPVQLDYSFGFQATPVKPVERDAWETRMVCINQRTEGSRPRLRVDDGYLDTLAARGVRSVTLFEHWTDAEGHVATPHAAQVARIVDQCHARGLEVLLYFGFLASDRAPEWSRLGKDCITLPKAGYPLYLYEPQPPQAAWRVCLNSDWQDLLVAGIAAALDHFEADGVYLDGTEAVWGCLNTEHDCGVRHADGSLRPRYPIFGVREAMRRIYEVVRRRRPQGQVFVHNSGVMTMPTLAWATTAWDGEQFQGAGGDADVASLLPLDVFRTEFYGGPWGVATEFLLAGYAYTWDQVAGLALLHDVPVKPMDLGQLEAMAALWQVMDAFDRGHAAWTPYWKADPRVRPGPRGVAASFYRHPEHGLLVVLTSLRAAPTVAWMRLDLEGLGLPRGPVLDARTGAAIPLRAGRLRCRLPPFGWRLLRVPG